MMVNSSNAELHREIDRLQEQMRALNTRIVDLQSQFSDFQQEQAEATGTTPTVSNYANNGDFTFHEAGYTGAGYVGATDDAAQWYARISDAAGQWTENTSVTQSPDALINNGSLDSYWFKDGGIAVLGGKMALGHPLSKNVALPGSILFATLQLKTNTGVTIPESYKLRVGIWDNTAGIERIIEAATFNITAVPTFPAPGTFDRDYILRVDTASTFFYSNVTAPVSVANQVSVSAIDNTNFVSVRWTPFPEALRYRLYRFDSEFSEWRLIADIANGAVQFEDKGGRSGSLFTPPLTNVNLKAEANFPGFGQSLNDSDFTDILLSIRIPSAYVYSLTTNKQWFRLDVLDASDNFVTLGAGDLFVDKVSVSYTSGRWSFSAKDLDVPTTIVTQDPPPTVPPGDNEPPPDDGSGRYGNKYYNFDQL